MTLPEGWAETTVGEVVQPIESGNPASEPDQTFRYVDIGSIDNRLLSITEPKKILGRDAPSRARRRIRSGDILFSTVRPYLKNIAQVPTDLDGDFTSTGICVLRPQEGVESSFLFRRVASQDFIGAMTLASDGTMYPAIADKDVFAGAISLPPAAEQRRIVAKLDALIARLARARTELDRVPVLADRFRESALGRELAFEFEANGLGGEQETPEDKISSPLSALVAFNPKHDKNCDRSQPITFVPMAAVSDVAGVIGETSPRMLDEVWSGYTHFANGDVLFAKITPCMENGKSAVAYGLVNGLGCGSTEFYVLRPKSAIQAKILWYFLRSIKLRSVAATKMTGAVGQRRVPRSYLENLRFKRRSIEEQDDIIRRLDQSFARADRMEAEAARARALIDRLEAAILAKAFRGELVPQDPRDEPASVLLDRIRARRAAAPQPKRGRRAKAEA